MAGFEHARGGSDRGAGPRLLDRVREKTRLLHMPVRTEKTYVQWIERFLRFHHSRVGQWRHP